MQKPRDLDLMLTTARLVGAGHTYVSAARAVMRDESTVRRWSKLPQFKAERERALAAIAGKIGVRNLSYDPSSSQHRRAHMVAKPGERTSTGVFRTMFASAFGLGSQQPSGFGAMFGCSGVVVFPARLETS